MEWRDERAHSVMGLVACRASRRGVPAVAPGLERLGRRKRGVHNQQAVLVVVLLLVLVLVVVVVVTVLVVVVSAVVVVVVVVVVVIGVFCCCCCRRHPPTYVGVLITSTRDVRDEKRHLQ